MISGCNRWLAAVMTAAAVAGAATLVAPAQTPQDGAAGAGKTALKPETLVLQYTDSGVQIGPLLFVAGTQKIGDVQAALGAPDRKVTAAAPAGRAVVYVYDSLGLSFVHAESSPEGHLDLVVRMDSGPGGGSVLAPQGPWGGGLTGDARPSSAFSGVVSMRSIRLRAPVQARVLSEQCHAAFRNGEAIRGSEKLPGTVLRYGKCRTSFTALHPAGVIRDLILTRAADEVQGGGLKVQPDASPAGRDGMPGGTPGVKRK